MRPKDIRAHIASELRRINNVLCAVATAVKAAGGALARFAMYLERPGSLDDLTGDRLAEFAN